jgi:hypothetical protein
VAKLFLPSVRCPCCGHANDIDFRFSPTLATVTPRNLCRFLIYKDKNGKTQVHGNACSFLGQRGVHSCKCPMHLSYKTVDSYIGKLRAIFHTMGRDGEWDKWLCLGNPAADKLVKDYL